MSTAEVERYLRKGADIGDLRGKAGAAKLRIGLLVDSLIQPAWVRRIVEQIHCSSIASVALVVMNGAPPDAPRPGSRLGALYRNRARLLYELYSKLDQRKFAVRPDAFAPADIAPLIEGVPVLTVTPRATEFSDYFAEADVAALRARELDVVLRFGFRILRGDVLSVARYGVWSYHHGDSAVRRGGPAGFWEVMDGRPVTGSVLQILSEELDGGRVIYRSYSSTHPISVNKNRHHYYWKSSTFVMRKLRDLHRDGVAALGEAAPRREGPPAYCERLYLRPTNTQMVRLLGRMAGRYVGKILETRATYGQWALAYRLTPEHRGRQDAVPDLVLHRFRMLEPSPDRFWADPFVAFAGGRHHILFEDYSYTTRRGRISAITIEPNGEPTAPVPVLDLPYHLSYPSLFEWRGEHYMVPESSANRSVDVYRATRFPYEWTHEAKLAANDQLVDVTIQEIDGRWWMFANAPATPDVHYESWVWDELHVFYADSPLGPWTPHPANPVVSDVRRARPAGRLFRYNGAWYRPAQDCGGRYGARLAIQRITRLDPERYDEVPVTTLGPSWRPGLTGLHTVNAAGGLTVIDVRRRRWQNPITARYSKGLLHAEEFLQRSEDGLLHVAPATR
ncbi:MAG: hypothetical protein FJ027_01280 [Candidatus Rokubacteria bacterium]|nr:hypothetical protein [Candidatus Rokubacteria bacterium]